MKEVIEKYTEEIKNFVANSKEELEDFRLKFLSRKGIVNDLFEAFKAMPPEEKKQFGKVMNEFKSLAENAFNTFKEKLEEVEVSAENTVDYTLPGEAFSTGSRHPVSLVLKEINEIFQRMGFSIAKGPEIEDDWHNFSSLNFPMEHPARDMQDTFFVRKDANKPEDDLALRTHTSSVQIRLMESGKPPFRSIMPGRVFRNEAISARSHCIFHQVEGLYVDTDVSFADLKQTLYYFVQELFGVGTEVRFRPSYFPFTEPSAEMDIQCKNCGGTGCNICKYSGWVEILGCGMVDPNVLQNCGIDPTEYSGFAFGVGIERLAMNKFKIKDIRMFFENDVRLLSQFNSELI
jgi:phenylalanyl-tRNA synthetase alpha chain